MTVVNTSNNPVPVTGSVGVTGGVTVNNPSSPPVPVSGVVVSGEVTELIHESFVQVDGSEDRSTYGV